MGQESSKSSESGRASGLAHHRRVTASSAVAPAKSGPPPPINTQLSASSSPSNLPQPYRSNLLANSLSLLGTSPLSDNSSLDKLPRIYQLLGVTPQTHLPSSPSDGGDSDDHASQLLSVSVPSSEFIPGGLLSSRRPSLPSSNPPIPSSNHYQQPPQRPRMASHDPQLITLVSAPRDSTHPNSEVDPILSKLNALPKVPSAFQKPNLNVPNTPPLHLTSTITGGFPFPGLWPRSSPTPIKPPKLHINSSDELELYVILIVDAFQAHTKTSARLLIRNQLSNDIKDCETSCQHILTYTSPHLNHLKESHSQISSIVSELEGEMLATRQHMRSIFKAMERINSQLDDQTERIGYLKYQNQARHPNLHKAYRTAMLQGSVSPQLSTTSASVRPCTGSGILGRRRRESAVALTLDSVLSDRHRHPLPTTGETLRSPTADYFSRPLSSTSRTSIEEFGISASQKLYDIATLSRPQTAASLRTSTYTPSLRTNSPSGTNLPLRHSTPSYHHHYHGSYHQQLSTARYDDSNHSSGTPTLRPTSPLGPRSAHHHHLVMVGPTDLESRLLLHPATNAG